MRTTTVLKSYCNPKDPSGDGVYIVAPPFQNVCVFAGSIGVPREAFLLAKGPKLKLEGSLLEKMCTINKAKQMTPSREETA